MNPPLRSAEHRDALRAGWPRGRSTPIATDHAPHALEDKEQEFDQAPPGTTGLETALAVVLTELVEPGISRLLRRRATAVHAPAAILGLEDHGGPDRGRVVRRTWSCSTRRRNGRSGSGRSASMARNTAFTGRRLRGPRASTRCCAANSPSGRASRPGERRRRPDALLVLEDGTAFRGTGVRRRGRGVRRGGVQHRHVRLPGGAHRPLVPRPDRDDDGAPLRELRRQPRGRRVGARCRSPASSCARLSPRARRGERPGTLADYAAPTRASSASRASTRGALTLRIREAGAMRAAVSTVDLDPASLRRTGPRTAGDGGRRPGGRRLVR